MSIAITNNQFVEKVLNTEGSVLVDFGRHGAALAGCFPLL